MSVCPFFFAEKYGIIAILTIFLTRFLKVVVFYSREKRLMTDENIRALLNNILKDLFFRILRIQERSVSQTSNDEISRTEMHALEVIEDTRDVTLTQLADKLGITKATASVCVSRLAKKDYIDKIKVKRDKRKSVLRLTEKGLFCCARHRDFHNKMVDRILGEFKINEHQELLKSLQALYTFFGDMEKELD